MNIQGNIALVTGGGSGLGAATARELAKQGAKVAVLDVNAEGAKNVDYQFKLLPSLREYAAHGCG